MRTADHCGPPSAETWALTVRGEGYGPSLPIRVRRLLKAALRHYGLRCVGIGIAGSTSPRAHAALAVTAGDFLRRSQ